MARGEKRNLREPNEDSREQKEGGVPYELLCLVVTGTWAKIHVLAQGWHGHPRDGARSSACCIWDC